MRKGVDMLWAAVNYSQAVSLTSAGNWRSTTNDPKVQHRYVRYEAGGQISYGLVEGETIHQVKGDLFDGQELTGRTEKLSEVRLLLPLDPSRVSKVIGVAGNFPPPDDRTDAPHPRWFAKLPTSLNPHEATVDLPPFAENFNFEGELVLVIGKEGRHISIEDAPGYVFGVTIGNDWSENTWYYEEAGVDQPSRQIAKSLDTWACLFTTIVTGLDYSDLPIKIRVNGVAASEGRTSQMINRPDWLIAYFSQFVTLLPGDLIYTGTPVLLPDQSRIVKDGDEVEVEIPPIGVLRNRVVAMDEGLFPDQGSMKIRSAQ